MFYTISPAVVLSFISNVLIFKNNTKNNPSIQMTKRLCYSIFILIISCYIISTNDECQLINNNDIIDDCNCRISDINEFNNQRLYPLLHEIVEKNYFRFYPVNLRKKCLF